MDFVFKEHYNVYDLFEIVRILRSPEGCPWDKVQTHETIRGEFIEEVYEAVEAIDEKDPVHLREELGDVLLQVVFHCVLEKEKDSFAAAVDCEAFFLPDDLVMSEPIECTVGLEEDIIDLDDEAVNSVFIELHSADDASLLADNANITRLPVTVHANDSTTLEAALRYFQGRLIVDTRCDIDKGELEMLASRYGAILY